MKDEYELKLSEQRSFIEEVINQPDQNPKKEQKPKGLVKEQKERPVKFLEAIRRIKDNSSDENSDESSDSEDGSLIKREPKKKDYKIHAKNEEDKAEEDDLLDDKINLFLDSLIQQDEITKRETTSIHLKLNSSGVWDYDKLKKMETVDILLIDGVGTSFLPIVGGEKRFNNTLLYLMKVTK